MKKFKMSLKINLRVVGIIVICLVIVFLNLKYILARKYAEDVSPDDNYKMIIYQFPTISAGFPGQGGAGGSPGYLVVRDVNTNRKIASEETYMLDAAFPISWTPEEVTAGNFITIELPDTYHDVPENRQYFLQKQLVQATRKGNLDLVKKLLKEGAVLDERASYPNNLVRIAAARKDLKMVSFLLNQNDYLQRLNQVKNGIFTDQQIQENPFVISFLIQNGLNPNQVNSHNYSPLHISIQLEKIEAFKTLIVNGAIIDIDDPRVRFNFEQTSPEFQKKVLELLKERKEDE